MTHKLRRWFRKVLGFSSPPALVPYRGYGNPGRVWLRGHVLDNRMLGKSNEETRRLKNMHNMIRRFMSRPLEGVKVTIHFMDQTVEVRTNEGGYFETEMAFDPPIEGAGWLKAKYEVLGPLKKGEEGLHCECEVYIDSGQAAFGVISDIDDTVLISHATRLWKRLRTILFKNAHTRLPFPGVAAFYQALHVEPNRTWPNPIFYVSSSQWNLYDFLVEFMRRREIPKGPLLLKKLSVSLRSFQKEKAHSHEHKYKKIKHLLEAHPEMRFILIGDSGQRDAMIYARIVEEYPGRILSIYIRDVSKTKKDAEILEIAKSLGSHKVEMLLVADTEQAAIHALEKGYINLEGLDAVRQELAAKVKVKKGISDLD